MFKVLIELINGSQVLFEHDHRDEADETYDLLTAKHLNSPFDDNPFQMECDNDRKYWLRPSAIVLVAMQGDSNV